MKRILITLQKKFVALLKLYGSGLIGTITVVAILAIFSLVKIAAELIETMLSWFIPEKYLFPGNGLVVILVILPFIIVILAKVGWRSNRIFKKIPILNLLFTEDEAEFQQGIPVAVKIMTGYSYGILRGWSEIQGDTDFAGGDLWLSVFIPSSPTPFTSLMVPSNFRPEDVDEFEIITKPGKNQALAAIIQRECLRFGQPPSSKIRLMKLDLNEVKKLPALSEEDKEIIAQEYKSTE